MIQIANQILQKLREDNFNFDSCYKELHEFKKQFVEKGDERNANICWVIESVVKAHQDYLSMHQMLLNGKYQEAWDKAEQVEIQIKSTLRVCTSVKSALELLANNVFQLQSLYPYKLFASTEFVIKKRTCSICGKVRSIRNHCGHYAGYLYNGEMCYDIVEQFSIDGLAIVTNPEHKYSVLLPEDSKPDYRPIEELMKYWKNPYTKWKYTVNTTYGVDSMGEKIPIHKEYVIMNG